MSTFHHESWKVEVVVDNQEPKVTYFATEALAQAAVEAAYSSFITELGRRTDIEKIDEEPDPASGAWKLRDLYGKKVTYWRRHPKGFVPIKNYFTAERDVFHREVEESLPAPLN